MRRLRHESYAISVVLVVVSLLLGFSLDVDLARADLTTGLMGSWKFDEGVGSIAHDSSPNGYNGTISGATWVPRGSGHALFFDGTNDYVNIGNRPLLNITHPISISAVVQLQAFGRPRDIVSHGHSGYVCFFNTGNCLQLARQGGGGYGISGRPLTDSQLHHVVAVYDGSREWVYLDGQLDNTGPASLGFQNTQTLRIGACVSHGEYFSGLIDDVRIYNCVLGPTEVTELYLTDIDAAFLGAATDLQSGGPLEGVLVEALLGGNVMGSSATNSSGLYQVSGLSNGDYVLRATRADYTAETTDLYRYRGVPIRVAFEMEPLAGGDYPDAMISVRDITCTVLQSGAIAVTAMVHNLGAMVDHLQVRFVAEDVSGGHGAQIPMANDQFVDLDQGGAEALTVTWTPQSGFDRFHVLLDPGNSIVELSELNNAAHRDLGAVGQSPPAVTSVTAQYDGNPSPDIVGRFMAGIDETINYFIAQVTDPDGDEDIARVEFAFGDAVVIDSSPNGGWRVAFDLGALPPHPVTLTVTAVDRAGLRSEPKAVTIDMFAMPAWLVGSFTVATGNWAPSFALEEGYLTAKLCYSPGGGGEDLFVYMYEIQQGIFLLESTQNTSESSFCLELGIPLSQSVGPKARVAYSNSQSYFSKETRSFEGAFNIVLNPDYSLEGFSFELESEILFYSFEYLVSIPIVPPISAIVGIGFDLYARLGDEIGVDHDFSNVFYRFSPGCSAQINITAGVGLGFLGWGEMVISPRLNLDMDLVFQTQQGFDASVEGAMEVLWRLRLCVLWGAWCHEFASGSWGPFTFYEWNPGTRGAFDYRLTVPDPLAYPTLRSGPENRLGVVWVRDTDPNPTRVDPEVMFAWSDSAGTWSQPIMVTGGGSGDVYFQTNPVFDFEPSGAAVAVWVQNAITEEVYERQVPTLSEVLDNQDLCAARWEGANWSAPFPVTYDIAGPLRADGFPAFDIAAGGNGLLVWTRCLGDSAMTLGTREIFYATYNPIDLFSAPARLTSDGLDDYNAAVAVGCDGRAVAVWLRDLPGRDLGASMNEVMTATWDGDQWSAPAILVSADHLHRTPAVTCLPNGDAAACWVTVEMLPDSQAIYTLHSSRLDHASGLWDVASAVHSSPFMTDSPRLDADARGNAVITWRGHDGFDCDLFATVRDLSVPSSHWTAPDTLSRDDLNDWMLSAAVDEQNNLHFVDLKSDLSDTTGVVNRGNFFDGLALGARGIGADGRLEEDLNFGFRPLSADLKAVGAPVASTLWPLAGAPDTLRQRVTNIGAVVSTGTTVLFTNGHPDSGGVVIATVPLAALYPGDSLTAEAIWTAQVGRHELWVWIDPGGAVPEQTESNNRAMTSIAVDADLVAIGTYAVSDNPAPGDSITVYGVVRNLGGAAANNAGIRLLALAEGAPGPDTLVTLVLPLLGVGEADTVSGRWIAPAGISHLITTADPDSSITEWREDNNTRSEPMKVLADIAFVGESLEMTISPDSTHSISATLVNDGGLAVASVPVRFYRDDPMAQGALLGEVTLPGIEAFSEEQVQLIVPFQVGVVSLHVIADEPDSIPERDEYNNRAQRQFLFTLLPDLAITAEDVQIHGYEGPGIPFRILTSIHNRGLADVVAPRVQFFDGHPDSGGIFIGGRIVPSILRDSTAVLELEWVVADSVDHRIFAWADREQIIAELREDNNLAGGHLWQTAGVNGHNTRGFTGLLPAFPNPLCMTTTVRFALGRGAEVDLRILDVTGRLVRTLLKRIESAGVHGLIWDGRDDRRNAVGTGIYFIRMEAERTVYKRKIALLR